MNSRRFHLIIVVLLLISTTLGVLMQSRAFLQWSWRQLETLSHGIVTAQQVDGTLAGPISVVGLRVTLPSSEIAVSTAQVDWHAGQLLFGRLALIAAQGGEVVITLHPRQDQPPSTTAGVAAPLTLLVEEATLQRLVIRREGMQELVFENIALQEAEWRTTRLWLERATFDTPWGALDAHGYAATHSDTPLELQTVFTPARSLIATPLQLTGSVTGTLGRPQFAQQLSGITEGRISGAIDWAPGPLHWQAQADIAPVSLQALRPVWRPLVVGGHLEGSGDFHRNQLRATYTLADAALGRWQGAAALTQEGSLLAIEQLQLRGDGHAAQLEGQGKLRLAGAPDYVTDADLQLRWRDLVWPVSGVDAKVRSNDGAAQLSGALHDYRLTTELALAAPNYPPSRWQVTGEGDLHHFSSRSVQLQGLGGSASGEASVTWSPQLAWHARLAGKGLDPGRQWSQWPGRLDLVISSDGDWQGPRTLNIDVHSLHGTLRGYRLGGKGRVDYRDGHWNLAALQLNSGSASFSAAGLLTAPWDLSWTLAAPQLNHLLPQAHGRLQSSGTLRGTTQQPHITLDGAATELAWQQLRLRSARLKADVDLATQSPWLLQLHGDELRWDDYALLESIDLNGAGSAAAHQLQLEVARANGRLSLQADGEYRDSLWHGALHSGRWEMRDGESLYQEAPAPFSVSAASQSLAPFCWKGEEARGCLDYQPDAAGGHVANASLTALPVQLFAQWLPRKDVQVEGKIFAEGHARLDGGLREATLAAHVAGGGLHYRHPLGSTIDLLFKTFAVNVVSQEGGSSARADLALTNGDTMQLQGRLPGWSAGMPLPPGQPVEGGATLSMHDLTWMALLVPEILEPKGVITANLALGGSAGDPRLTGTLALDDGSVSIPRAGLKLRKLALAASSPDGVSLRLSGAATSGPGWVTIEGNLRGESLDKWRSEFLLRGDRFEALRLPSVHLLASPEIRATVEPYRLDVEGTLRVPEADIKLPELPTTVRQSSDVVLVNGAEIVTPPERWQVDSRLTLQLGDYVRLEGYGFKGRIGGQLTVTERPDALATGQGELSVYDARYKAYGQDLSIDYGRLLFANSPIDNPALDVRASRQRDEVTVGVNITGRLQRPELRLFSEPPMEESDALAYLVLGHPLRSASASEATSVSAAATSIGLVGGERIAQAIGSEFGVDEVSVGSEYQSTEAALLLGKYLSPRLYLQYAVVFSNALNVTRLRYELTNHWYIKAESGEQQAVDIMYTFER